MKKILFLTLLIINGFSIGQNILTPSGYKASSAIHIGDTVIGFDNGIQVKNIVLVDSAWTKETDTANQGSFDFYKINGLWNLYKNQSVWVNNNVAHAFEIKVGDTLINSIGLNVIVTSIIKDTDVYWYRLAISGNHTYIQDNIVLHNASRFWVGGGASANWNATSNTNWSATSGGSNNASVPGSADAVTFDGAGASGNTNSTVSAGITINSFTNTTGYTHTITTNVTLSIAGNITLATGIQWAGTAAWNITATSTFTSNGVVFVPPITLTMSTNTLTISGNLSCSSFTYASGAVVNSATSETVTVSNGLGTTANTNVGTAPFILTGGTLSASFNLSNPITLSGNVTMTGTIPFRGSSFTYNSGTITTTGSTLSISSNATLNCNGMTFNNISISSITITLASNLSCSGLFTWSGGSATINGSFNITTSGGLTLDGGTHQLTGAASLVVSGGTITPSGTTPTSGYVGLPLTLSGNVSWASGTIAYSGTITFSSGTQTFNNGFVLDLTSAGSSTITNNINGLSTIPSLLMDNTGNSTQTFNGSYGISIGTLTIKMSGSNALIVSLLYGNTYSVNTNFLCYISSSTPVTYPLIKSSSAGNQVALNLASSASQAIERLNFTDVTAAGSQTIYTYSPSIQPVTLTNTTNINAFTGTPVTVGSGFAN